jgi:hypothetical protein
MRKVRRITLSTGTAIAGMPMLHIPGIHGERGPVRILPDPGRVSDHSGSRGKGAGMAGETPGNLDC